MRRKLPRLIKRMCQISCVLFLVNVLIKMLNSSLITTENEFLYLTTETSTNEPTTESTDIIENCTISQGKLVSLNSLC